MKVTPKREREIESTVKNPQLHLFARIQLSFFYVLLRFSSNDDFLKASFKNYVK
jgi:hypothetical protein